MTTRMIEKHIEEYFEAERRRRNEELRAALLKGQTFEEILAELDSLGGFNVAEREAARSGHPAIA